MSECSSHECPSLGLGFSQPDTLQTCPAPAFQERRRGGVEGRGLEALHPPARAVFSEPGLWAVHPCVRRGCGGFLPRLPASPVRACGCAGASASFHVNAYMQMQTSVHTGRGLCVPAHRVCIWISGKCLGPRLCARGPSKVCLWACPRVCVPACIRASALSKCKDGCVRPHLQVPSPSLLGCGHPASLFGSLKGAPVPWQGPRLGGQ